MTEVESLFAALEDVDQIDHTGRRAPLSVLADWHEERGLDDVSAALKWMRDNNKRPARSSGHAAPRLYYWFKMLGPDDQTASGLRGGLFQRLEGRTNRFTSDWSSSYPDYSEAVADLAQALKAEGLI